MDDLAVRKDLILKNDLTVRKDLILKNDLPNTLTIECDKVCIKQKDLELNVEIDTSKIERFDYIIINGIKFRKLC